MPAQRLQPAQEKSRHAVAGLVGPQAIELLAQDIRLEQPPIRRKELPAARARFEPRTVFHRRNSNQRFPRPYARITAPARKNSWRRTSSSAARRVLQDVELIEHDLRRRQHSCATAFTIRPMHVRADGLDRGALPRVEARRQQASPGCLPSGLVANPITSPCTRSDSTV